MTTQPARLPAKPEGGSDAAGQPARWSALEAFLESTPDIVFFKDRESRFTAVSRSLYTLHGFATAEPMLGKTDHDFYPPEFADKTLADEQEIIRTGQPLHLVEELQLEDDRLVWLDYSKCPLVDEDGSILGIVCVVRDTTTPTAADLATREQAERLRRVIELQRSVASAGLDRRRVLELICERTQELTRADGVCVLLLEGEELVYHFATGFCAGNIGLRLPLEGTFCGWVVRENRPGVVVDTKTDSRADKLAAAEYGLRSLGAVPLRHGNQTVGELVVLSPRANAFGLETVRTLELVSMVAAAALANAAEYEAKRAEVEALERFRALFEAAPIGLARIEAPGRVVEANPALEEMLGYSAAELARLSFDQFTHPDDLPLCTRLIGELLAGERDAYRMEKRFFHKDGRLVWAHVSVRLVRDGGGAPSHGIAMVEDVSLRKVAEEALLREAERNEYQALHDSLTGLANRALFRERIEQAIFEARRAGGSLAVLMMDLDRFKEINDSLGHDAGDALLKRLGDRLHVALASSDVVARLGGDEFGVLLPQVSSAEDVVDLIATMRRAVEEPVVLQGLPLAVEASIGVAFFPQDGGDVDSLLRHADVAMYRAKEASSTYAFYDAATDTYDPARLTLVSELRGAIERRELVLHYQPKANLSTGRVSSVEALLRWRHPERGLLLPDAFVPLAQRTSLITPLAFFVVREALAQCRAWKEQGLELSVAVNLSMRNLLDLGFPDEVSSLLEASAVDPALLELEITESTMLADPARVAIVLGRLSALGVRLAIDDFGTGYSSLSHLRRLPIDVIKIDRSFVTTMTTHEDDATIVRSTIELAKNLGLEVVAEGVETKETWERLRALGCSQAQGLFLSRPLPAQRVAPWLREHASVASAA